MALVLVVDGDPEVRETIAVALQGDGHEVVEIDSIDQAKQHIAQRLPDLIMLDLSLSNGDGLDYLTQLGEQEQTKHIAVVVISALRQKRNVVEGLNAGAIDYITKPFEIAELKLRVTAALKIYELKLAQIRNQELESMRETARTVQYEIELPMREIQNCLIQLRNDTEEFSDRDRTIVEKSWSHYSRLEDILSRVQRSGYVGARLET